MTLICKSRQLLHCKKIPFACFQYCSSSYGQSRPEQGDQIYDEEIVLKTGRGIKVAMIGCPNSGKSSLTNLLVRAKVCAVSKLIDTTTANMTTSLTESISCVPMLPKCQLVVVDSPGIIGMKHATNIIGTDTNSDILAGPEDAVKFADHILVVHDATMGGDYIHHRLLHILHRYSHIPASLVLNKIDLIERRTDLLALAEALTLGIIDGSPILKSTSSVGRLGNAIIPNSRKDAFTQEGIRIHPTGSDEMDEKWQTSYQQLLQKPTYKCSWTQTMKLFAHQKGWPNFKSVFFVSCKKGTGADELREHLKELSNETVWKYSENTKSSKEMEKNMVEHVRSEFMDNLPAYIAYTMRFHIVEFELLEGIDKPTIRFVLDLICEKKHWAKTVFRIASRVECKLIDHFSKLFEADVQLRFFVKHKGKLITSSEKEEDPNKKKS